MAFAQSGFKEVDRRQDGDWAALLLRRGAPLQATG
jgi:hypothetical protein